MTTRLATRGLLRDTAHLSIGQGFRLVIQAAYFVLVARALGPRYYGAFVTAVAIAALLGPFSGLGAPNLFIKNVRSGKRQASLCWGNGMLLCAVSGALLVGVAVALAWALHLRLPLIVTLAVSFADLVLLKITELAASGFTALDRMRQTSVQSVVVSGLRLTGIVGLLSLARTVTLEQWVLVYLLTTLLGTIYAFVRATHCWGTALHATGGPARRRGRRHVLQHRGLGGTTIYNDIDKIMLSWLGNLEATGVYAAAYRVIDVSMTPVRSLAAAAYPHFFRHGLDGMQATYRYALSLIAKASMFGAVVSIALWLSAPLLPHILGAKYNAAVPAVRWLALIPFLRCLHSFMADALSGAGLQRTRTTLQVLVAVANIGINLIVLPRYSWRGAAWSSLGCDGLLVVLFWSTAAYYCRRIPDRYGEARPSFR